MTRNQVADYTIGLLRSVFEGQQPQEKPVAIGFEEVYNFAKFHCVEAMVFYAIEKLQEQPEEQLFQEWQANRDGNIIKTMNQLAELESLSDLLTQAQIKHLPLKGSVLIHDYPQLDFRYLGDLDILVEANKTKEVYDLLLERGAVNDDYGVTNHDSYLFDKGFYRIIVEIHRQLFDRTVPYAPYFDEDQLLSQSNSYRQEMSLEDFYVYMMAHFAKHFFKGGSGIRSVMDVHVFMEKYEEQLDWDLVKGRLEQMDLLDFDQSARKLARVWFGQEVWSDDLEDLAQVVISQGAYGTFEHRVDNQLQESLKTSGSGLVGKFRYFWDRVFIERRFIQKDYPYTKRYPILLPLGYGHRLVNGVFKKRDRVKYELNSLLKSQDTDE